MAGRSTRASSEKRKKEEAADPARLAEELRNLIACQAEREPADEPTDAELALATAVRDGLVASIAALPPRAVVSKAAATKLRLQHHELAELQSRLTDSR
jgi:hypothetical protein